MARKVGSFREAADNMVKTVRAGRAGAPRDLDALGLRLVNEIKLELSKPGTGRLYTTRFWTDKQGRLRRGGRRVPHRASAPGEPPAVDTGKLRASYGHKADRKAPGVDELVIGTGVEYAKFLEFGTIKMKPRPHLRPVILRNYETVRKAAADGLTGREKAMARKLGGDG